MNDLPNWFNPDEYSKFLMESADLYEAVNVPLWKEKAKSRKQMIDLERQHAIRKARLKSENMRDEGQARARGIQMGLGEEFRQYMMNEFLNKLQEANNPLKSEKRKMRPEVNPADRERDRKREQRKQDAQTPLSNVLIVRNKNTGKLEIIVKTDYEDDTHEVLKGKVKNIDKGSISKSDLLRVSKKAEFINTKTSIKLIGKVTKEDEETQEPTTGKSESSSYTPPPAPMPRVPEDGKEITDPESTYPDWDHSSQTLATGVALGMNTMLSGQPMPPEFSQSISASRTLGDSINRAVNELLQNAPALQGMQFMPLPPVVKTGKNWKKFFKVDQSAPAASLLGSNDQGQIGIGVKIGEQIRPTSKEDAEPVFYSVVGGLPQEELAQDFSFMLQDFFEDLRKTFMTQMPNMETGIISDKQGAAKLKEKRVKKENFEDLKNVFKNRAKNLVESFLNDLEDVKAAFLLEALTGNNKFEGGLGSAKLLITMKKDGTDAKVIPLDPKMMYRMAASDTVSLSIRFIEDPQENSYIETLYQKLLPLNESALGVVMDLETMKSDIVNPIALLQLFELKIADITYRTPINYTDYFDEDSDVDNVVIINPESNAEREIKIPVSKNYDTRGNQEKVIEKGIDDVLHEYFIFNDYLIDLVSMGRMNKDEALNYLHEEFNFLTESKKKKKRNYRKEYDEYHGTAKQRANRSKRVLARRKMMKKGKVKKGDGNDVHHKDGNPQNNGHDNLSVMSKHKNRSIKEDHGAGFEGTPELIDVLKKATPGAETTPVLRFSKKYQETKNIKKK
jgi:hypothetical protein